LQADEIGVLNTAGGQRMTFSEMVSAGSEWWKFNITVFETSTSRVLARVLYRDALNSTVKGLELQSEPLSGSKEYLNLSICL